MCWCLPPLTSMSPLLRCRNNAEVTQVVNAKAITVGTSSTA